MYAKSLVLILTLQVINFQLLLSIRLPLAIRSVAFEHNYVSKKLHQKEILSLQKVSIIGCSFACNIHPECLSFNYCSNKLCRLNSEDIFSTQSAAEDILVDDHDCRYVGIGRQEKPNCEEKGSAIDIQDDETSAQTCAITGKRVDQVWTPWFEEELIGRRLSNWGR